MRSSKNHGLSNDAEGKRSRLYHIWEDMKSRCNNPNNRRFKDYGGRGIIVCQSWNDYPTFHLWAISNGYNHTLTIDRLRVNENYEPSNCRWATQKEQANNRRTNRVLSLDGVSKTVAEWAIEKNMPYHVIKNRIKRGWTVERALNTLPEKHKKRAA